MKFVSVAPDSSTSRIAALSKPLFPLASGVIPVLGARFVDRIGKGIRGAPRDALVADLTLPGARGAAYGLRQFIAVRIDGGGKVVGVQSVFSGNTALRISCWTSIGGANAFP